MASNDRVEIPVDLALAPGLGNKIIADLRKELEPQLLKLQEELKQKAGTRVSGKQRFEQGGKTFEATGKLAGDAEFGTTDLNVTVKEIRQKIAKGLSKEAEELRKFKDSIRFQPDTEKAVRINEWLQANKDINNEMHFTLDSITKRFQRTAKQIDRESKAELRRGEMREQQAAKERRLAFQNTMLVGASSAIGIFGTAGFAALNVGFAAMSGGPLGAGIAAISSTIGLIVQGLEEAGQVSQQAAKSMGAISNQFKSAEAKTKGFDAFFDIGMQGINTASMNRRREIFKDSTSAPFMEGLEVFKRGSARGFDRLTSENPGALGILGLVPNFFIKAAQEIIAIGNKADSTRLEDARSALRNAQMAMSGNMPGMDADPYAMYLRMQNAAMTVNTEEQRWQQETLKALKDLVKDAEEKMKILKEKQLESDKYSQSKIDAFSASWQ